MFGAKMTPGTPAVGPSNRSPPFPIVPAFCGPANREKSRSEWQSRHMATCSVRYLPRARVSGSLGSVTFAAGGTFG